MLVAAHHLGGRKHTERSDRKEEMMMGMILCGPRNPFELQPALATKEKDCRTGSRAYCSLFFRIIFTFYTFFARFQINVFACFYLFAFDSLFMRVAFNSGLT